MIYLISYDLNRQKDYARLHARLLQYAAHARVLYSQGLVESNSSAFDVATDLLKYIDNDDGLLVSEVTKNLAWRSLLVSDETMEKWQTAARGC
jgi:hypothetical protein